MKSKSPLKYPVKPLFTTAIGLFGSLSTLLCCALPATLVALGMGSVFLSIITAFPMAIWIAQHKTSVFVLSGIVLILATIFYWRSRSLPCPADPKLAYYCNAMRRINGWMLLISIALYLIGFFFSFILIQLLD